MRTASLAEEEVRCSSASMRNCPSVAPGMNWLAKN
jgi:hypothetical protein